MNFTDVPELKITLSRDKVEEVKVLSSNDAANFFRSILSDSIDIHETFLVLFLDRRNKTIGWYKASQGGISGTVVDARLIFKKALDCLASNIILCHNHPSGQAEPSDPDTALTRKLVRGAELLDMRVFDHIIITSESHYSFADNGQI